MSFIINMKVIGQYRKDIYIVRDLIDLTYNIICSVMRVTEDDVRDITRTYRQFHKVMGVELPSLPAYWMGSITAVTSRADELIDVVGDMIDSKKVLGWVTPYHIDDVQFTDPKKLQSALQQRGFGLVGGNHLTRQLSSADRSQIDKDKLKNATRRVSPSTTRQVNAMFDREKKRR